MPKPPLNLSTPYSSPKFPRRIPAARHLQPQTRRNSSRLRSHPPAIPLKTGEAAENSPLARSVSATCSISCRPWSVLARRSLAFSSKPAMIAGVDITWISVVCARVEMPRRCEAGQAAAWKCLLEEHTPVASAGRNQRASYAQLGNCFRRMKAAAHPRLLNL